VRVDSRTLAKTELAKANETIKDLRRTIESLESKLQASEAKNRKLQASEAKNRKLQTQVDGFRAANRKGSRRRGLKAA
jgi:septal ring factor EnvC (AmiA/AmiB activator)